MLRDRATILNPKRYELCLVEYNIPATYQEAVPGADATQWTAVIKNELNAH